MHDFQFEKERTCWVQDVDVGIHEEGEGSEERDEWDDAHVE